MVVSAFVMRGRRKLVGMLPKVMDVRRESETNPIVKIDEETLEVINGFVYLDVVR